MNRRTLTVTATIALAAGALITAPAGFVAGRTTAPTPDACITALNEGERALGLTADALSLSADAVVAAASWDYTTLDRIASDIDGITAEMGDGTTYQNAATECRGGSR